MRGTYPYLPAALCPCRTLPYRAARGPAGIPRQVQTVFRRPDGISPSSSPLFAPTPDAAALRRPYLPLLRAVPRRPSEVVAVAAQTSSP